MYTRVTQEWSFKKIGVHRFFKWCSLIWAFCENFMLIGALHQEEVAFGFLTKYWFLVNVNDLQSKIVIRGEGHNLRLHASLLSQFLEPNAAWTKFGVTTKSRFFPETTSTKVHQVRANHVLAFQYQGLTSPREPMHFLILLLSLLRASP